MNDSAKRIARLALMTALGMVLLFFTRIIPSGRLGLMVLASFPVCVALMMYGPGWASGVFAVTAILGFLLIPGPVAIGYSAFFGYYPIVKSFFERSRNRNLCWCLKFLLYAVVFAVYWFAAPALFGTAAQALPWLVLFLIGAAVFAVYDRCYSLVIRFYIEKIARYIP